MYQLQEFDQSVPLLKRVEDVIALPDVAGAISVVARKAMYELVLKYAFEYTGAQNLQELHGLAWILAKIHAGVQKVNGLDYAAVMNQLEILESSVLRQHMQSADLYKYIKERTPGLVPGYGTNMLLDLHATTEIFGQIVFEEPANPDVRFYRETQRAWGMVVDLGSGSEILGLGGVINCVRRKCNVILLGFDHNQFDIDQSHKVLSKLGGEIAAYRIDCTLEKADITTDEPFKQIALFAPDFPLQIWISETFGRVTPALNVGDRSVSWGGENVEMYRYWDPLPIVLQKQLQHDPDFLRKVRSGKVVMFPNITNGSVQFVYSLDSTICFNVYGSQMKGLNKVGSEFSGFESFGTSSRW